MITVICTQCRAQLEMDDAFAGGVCRCQFCGTIQTVPSMSKIKRRSASAHVAPPATPQVVPASPRPQAAAGGAAAPAEGLDALAEAVASSSGLGRGSLRSGPAVGAPAATEAAPPAQAPAASAPAPGFPPVDYARPPHQKERPAVLIVGVAIGAAVLLVMLGGMLFSTRIVVTTGAGSGNPGGGNSGATEQGGGADDIPIPTTPHFCGVSLEDEPSVVYVLDCGQATLTMFDTLKEATYRSLESLEPGQKFAVIFWTKGGEEAAYPTEGLATVSRNEIEAARTQFVDVYAGSRADPHAAITRAAALKPGAIVLVTGKAFELEEDLIDFTLRARAGSPIKVHTFALGSGDDSTILPRISKSTGGQHRVVTQRELRRYSD